MSTTTSGTCPRCGQAVTANAKWCQSCGAPLISQGMRPIPDGGLAEAMPAWLQPAQPTSTLPDDDLPPLQLASEADLPGWLRAIGKPNQGKEIAPITSTSEQPPVPRIFGASAANIDRGQPKSPVSADVFALLVTLVVVALVAFLIWKAT